MSPARPAPGRGRVKSGPGRIQWIALFTAGAVIMGLTFTLGVLVGRQWSRPVSAAASADSAARKTVPPGKRGGGPAARPARPTRRGRPRQRRAEARAARQAGRPLGRRRRAVTFSRPEAHLLPDAHGAAGPRPRPRPAAPPGHGTAHP